MPKPYHNNFNNRSLEPLDKTNTFRYLDENDFTKKMRSLKKYCMRSYKDLIFNTQLKDFYSLEDGVYIKNLYTSEEFKFVYGQIQLIYSVNKGHVVIEDLLPREILLDGCINLLGVYKGVPYRDDRDKFKIDLFMCMRRKKVYE